MTKQSRDFFQMQDLSNPVYERPNDPFVEVPAGPIKPYRKLEDGSFDFQEQEPTVRKPSLRRKRFVLSVSITAFTIGSLLILMSSPFSKEFLAPGPLHSSHGQLLAVQGADRCSACHSAATSSFSGWIAHAFSGASDNVTQSQLCLECHQESMNEQFALNPHNVDPVELAKRSQDFKQASFVSSFKTSPVNSNNEIACSACHREHKGNQDLKALTDAQCQTCHKENYHSFETDHPDFTNWPEASRQRIAFDHSSHSLKHFATKGEVFDCKQCHMDDNYKDVKTQVPFEQACASCHSDGIVESGLSGFALFALPMLDMRAIADAKLDVKGWPSDATGDFDGELPPAMRMLLMADPDASKVLEHRPASFQFSDFDADVEADVRDAVTLAWSVKKLLHGLANAGKSEFRSRLQQVLGRPVDDFEIDGMMGGIDQEAFVAARRRWLPNLAAELKEKFGIVNQSDVATIFGSQPSLARIRPQEQLADNPLLGASVPSSVGQRKEGLLLPNNDSSNRPTTNRIETQTPVASDIESGLVDIPTEIPIFNVAKKGSADLQTGWIRDDRSFRVLYRPLGHEDLFLKHWIDAVSKVSGADSRPETEALFISLTSENSIGNCRYCHTLKQQDDLSFVMNWKAEQRDLSVGQFTKFSHRPHLIQPELKDCTHCHQMDTEVSNADSFSSVHGCDYQSNFKTLSKSTCTKCHQEGLTSNSCTLCHGYHIGGHKSH
jgi:predicted CXXCH cytochrome family protein